uniref:Uncharacterized protein n=1 Tax=Leersia perrieri TaxID=77586 RepID=A0A0D9VVK3_9ORYZ
MRRRGRQSAAGAAARWRVARRRTRGGSAGRAGSAATAVDAAPGSLGTVLLSTTAPGSSPPPTPVRLLSSAFPSSSSPARGRGDQIRPLRASRPPDLAATTSLSETTLGQGPHGTAAVDGIVWSGENLNLDLLFFGAAIESEMV